MKFLSRFIEHGAFVHYLLKSGYSSKFVRNMRVYVTLLYVSTDLPTPDIICTFPLTKHTQLQDTLMLRCFKLMSVRTDKFLFTN